MARKRKSRPAVSDASEPPKTPPAKPVDSRCKTPATPTPPSVSSEIWLDGVPIGPATAADEEPVSVSSSTPKGENNTNELQCQGFSYANTNEPQQESSNETATAQATTATTTQDSKTDQGGDSSTTTAAVDEEPTTRVREESKAQAWERLRKQGRAAGLGKREAYERATVEIDRLYPPVPGVDPLPIIEESPIVAIPHEAAIEVVTPSDAGVSGLGSVPTGWPVLPSNASLAAEIQWVQSSRIDVVEELPGGAVRVDLGRADHPAPSKSALGWLETSIRAYSKYCDIAAKATASQEDEREHVRRERLAISDVSDLLAEMVGDDG